LVNGASLLNTMFLRQVKIGSLQNFGYLVADEKTKLAFVIDPSFNAKPLQRIADENGFQIIYILNTHSHRDHCSDNERLSQETGAKIAIHKLSHVPKDISLNDGDILKAGNLELKVIHTPGHSADSCCFIVDKAIFTGDTLFVGECGRTDLADSNMEAMHDSLLRKIRNLDDSLTVYKPRTLPEFIKFMSEP